MAAGLSSYWEDFLLQLQPHIPSMDSDSCSGTVKYSTEGDNRRPGDDIILERLVSFSEQQAASRPTSEPAAPEPEPVQRFQPTPRQRLNIATAAARDGHLRRASVTEGSETDQGRGAADVLLLVSPAVAPRCWGLVLSECLQRGFALSGLQRLQLHSKAARALGLTGSQALLFCKSPNATPGGKKTTLSSHCLALLLKTESATHHWTGLPAALMGEFEPQGLNGVGVNAAEPSSCFHVSLYTDHLRRCAARGDADAVLSGVRRPSSDPQDEDEEGQVVILSLCGRDLRQGLALLHRLLGGAPGDDGGGDEGDKGGGGGGGFELLDLTWLPALTGRQARELSPYEVGEELWPRSLGSLTAAPALVCALRRAEAFAALRRFLPRGRDRDAGRLDALMSPTPELAFRQAQLFFSQGEAVPAAGGFTSHRSTLCS
ncbi:unnamed protein product [Merluccius merluccius]